jgi:ribosomal protein S12 methylthiotransferase accessory factor
VSGQVIYVPALAVFMNYAVQRPEEFLFPVTSNGLAAGPTLLDAVLRASCEVLERDAFLMTWLHRLPCRRAEPQSHPDADVVRLWAAYRRRDVDLLLFRLPTDHPCAVFAALARQAPEAEGPAVVVGLGADLAPARAARKAVLETAQVRPGLRRRLRHPEVQQRMQALVSGAQRVETLDDHDLLYASQEAIGAFDFLLEQPVEPMDWGSPPDSSSDQMDRLIDWFANEHLDLLYTNLTPPDMERLHLHTVRAILPSFQPMHFGWNETRLGGDRLPSMPRRLELSPIGLAPGQLNPAPHPLA